MLDVPLLHGSVDLDVDNVADLVLSEVGRQRDHTLSLEVAGEGIASTSSETCGVTHLRGMC